MDFQNRRLIVGIGSALVDILLQESEEFLASSGAQRGGMVLVDSSHIEGLLLSCSAKPAMVPGGSACNTILGIGKLGNPARFIGKCGTDRLGTLFAEGLVRHNVEGVLFHSSSPTGRVLSIITPDAQRSMLTYLGASSEATAGELTASCFDRAAVVHIEGYLLFNHDLIRSALQMAREHGAKVSLDLASFTVVEQNRAILDELIRDYVDILIANEDEARALTGHENEEAALGALSALAPLAVLKLGKRGSMIASEGSVTRIGIMGDGKAVDSTGAGDLWAAGFLYGLVNGLPMQTCGTIAAACGYEVCQVVGAAIPEPGWTRIRQML